MIVNQPKISVVTVCFNAASILERTILSVLNQAYNNIEYIIIDGSSTDGSVDIIKKYSDRIAYWVSEPDKGIYDAMNKGIKVATGEWINFMNAGDTFCNENVLSAIFNSYKYEDVDVIYGNSILIDDIGQSKLIESSSKIDKLKYSPIYRHGASFVRTSLHKQFMFDLSKTRFGYALDYYCIYTLYSRGCKFKRVNCNILTYLNEGTSNHPFKNWYYNFLITSSNGVSIKLVLYDLYTLVNLVIRKIFSRYK